MSRRQPEPPNIVGVSTHDNMLDLDGKRKRFCVGCGGPRSVEYAETAPCSCCGSLGTQKNQPLFDEHGERIELAAVPTKAAPAPAAPKVKPPTQKQQQAKAKVATAALFAAARRGVSA
jgi:hypothetical protein